MPPAFLSVGLRANNERPSAEMMPLKQYLFIRAHVHLTKYARHSLISRELLRQQQGDLK